MTTLFEANVGMALDHLAQLVQRLKRRGRGSDGVRIERLNDTMVPPLLDLHREFACSPEVARARLSGRARDDNYCRSLSVALLLRQRIAGAFLVQRSQEEHTAFVYGVVITEALRGTWACAVLKHGALVNLEQRAIRTVRFQVEDGVQDTHRHAARVGATALTISPNGASTAQARVQDKARGFGEPARP